MRLPPAKALPDLFRLHSDGNKSKREHFPAKNFNQPGVACGGKKTQLSRFYYLERWPVQMVIPLSDGEFLTRLAANDIPRIRAEGIDLYLVAAVYCRGLIRTEMRFMD